jgi:hypothetical protein
MMTLTVIGLLLSLAQVLLTCAASSRALRRKHWWRGGRRRSLDVDKPR